MSRTFKQLSWEIGEQTHILKTCSIFAPRAMGGLSLWEFFQYLTGHILTFGPFWRITHIVISTIKATLPWAKFTTHNRTHTCRKTMALSLQLTLLKMTTMKGIVGGMRNDEEYPLTLIFNLNFTLILDLPAIKMLL